MLSICSYLVTVNDPRESTFVFGTCLIRKKVPHSLDTGNSPWLMDSPWLADWLAHPGCSPSDCLRSLAGSESVGGDINQLILHISPYLTPTPKNSSAMYPSAARRSLASLIPPKIATPNAVVSQPSSKLKHNQFKRHFITRPRSLVMCNHQMSNELTSCLVFGINLGPYFGRH